MIKVYFALFIGIVCVSLASIFIKLTGDVPSIIITVYRLVISSFLLLSYSFFKKKNVFGNDKKVLLIAALGGIFLSAHFIFWIASIQYTSIPSSVTLVATSPIFVGLFSYFILKEKQGSAIVISIALSVFGSIILASSDGGLFFKAFDKRALLGDMFALLGAVAVSGYFIVGSYLRRFMDIMSYITVVYSFAAFFSFIAALFFKEPFFGYNESSYLYMVLLAVIPQLIGHTSFNYALKYAKTSVVAISTLGEPIGASILAYVIFNEKIILMQGFGMAIILISILIAAMKAQKEIE